MSSVRHKTVCVTYEQMISCDRHRFSFEPRGSCVCQDGGCKSKKRVSAHGDRKALERIEGHLVDALVPRGDEGRGTLR